MPPEISVIQEKYAISKKMMYIKLFLILLFTGFVLGSSYIQNQVAIYIILFVFSIFLVITFALAPPPLSTYELIRYYLNELIVSLNSKDSRKAKFNLDMLAFELQELNAEIEDLFILRSSKQIISDFRYYLKYQVNPFLSSKDKVDLFRLYLEEIEKALSEENLSSLFNILKSVKNEDITPDKKGESNYLLPYEKPPVVNRFIKTFCNIFITNFQKNFVFKLFWILLLVIILGYYITTITSFKLDTTLISALIVLSTVIATQV